GESRARPSRPTARRLASPERRYATTRSLSRLAANLYGGPVKRDPYAVLGVSPGCSSEELHDAYRRLVKLHHPDRNQGSPEATRRFQEIQEAYEGLRGR